MRGITFTKINTVNYLFFGEESDQGKPYCNQIEECFDTLEKFITNPDNNAYLTYDEKNNMFTLFDEKENKYDFLFSKKQMEEFNNNENTLFNNRLRKCLKLSEDKKRYIEIQNSEDFKKAEDVLFHDDYLCSRAFKNTEDALFLAEYLSSRTDLDDFRILCAINYITENANKDYDKYIEFLNNRIKMQKKERFNETKESYLYVGTLAPLLLLFVLLTISLFFCLIEVNIIFLAFVIPFALTLFVGYVALRDRLYSIIGISTSYNNYIKDSKNKIEILKEKELQSKHTNSKQEELTNENKKISNIQFENIIGKSLYFIRNDALKLGGDIFEYVDKEASDIIKCYNEEMKSFRFNNGEIRLTLDTIDNIREKVLERVNYLYGYVTLNQAAKYHSSISNNENELDDDIVELLQQKPQNGYSRLLKQ